MNNGQEDGWENLTLNFDNSINNATISIVVDFINISSEPQAINETSDNFDQYVFYDSETNSTLLNLSSGDSANLTLTISTLDNSTFKDSSFTLNVKSRTEDVYSSTFYLYNRDN